MAAPALRFNEFDDSWDLKKLDQIAEVNPKTKELPSSFFYIDLESVSEGLLIQRKKIDINEAPSRAQRLLEKSDVLFQMVRPYQQNNFYFDLDGDYVASTGYAQIRTKLNSKYIYYVLHSKKILDEVINRCTGTSYPAINSSELSGIEVAFPSIREQTKIASFLSAVDEKITQLTQKHQLLSQYKQGMMQKLFSQQIRFKADDGSEFSEWSFSKLNNYINESKDKSKYQDEYDVLTSSRKGLIKQTEYFEDSRLADRDNIGFNIIKQNEITYRSRSDDGLFFFNLNKLGITGIISTYYPVINMKNSDNRFFHAYLNFHKHEYVKYAVGTSQLVLSLNELRNMKFYIPCLAEQTKIANFLSTIDQKIEVTEQQIKQAKQWKKGLLQQMFV
ncbi:restriction endonuclease subunit S [Acinetobacter soli]|uniref:Restriction endonuclease subunit S n=1 Tax=Acinetobacter soli TaxID=487316 RepID=A0AB38YUT2_9GAMM|nr:restriction endonuclease subunit S [Acinetobacter soli]WND05095.1 restriction endonuclease subunit S [Acinetobacter soli]